MWHAVPWHQCNYYWQHHLSEEVCFAVAWHHASHAVRLLSQHLRLPIDPMVPMLALIPQDVQLVVSKDALGLRERNGKLG